jgi:hypothetical protein
MGALRCTSSQLELPMRERPRTAGATTNRSTGLRRRQGGRPLLRTALWALALLAVPAEAANQGTEPWSWPLEVRPRAITGTFMEARQGGYHAGLDLRTEGRTGLPVRSPVEGWVSRVRTSPRGYGKALYVRTAEGQTLVLAHLSRFHAPVQEVVRAAMRRTGSYEQDLAIEAGRIPVRRGEVIALSGESGTGAPHLHLEVRDAAGRPQDPQRWLDVPDTVAPAVRALRLVPLDARAEALGPAGTQIVEASGADWVAARGEFALYVDVSDRTGFSPFEVAPLGVVLRVDGREHYRVEQRAFDFEHASDLHLELEREGERRWLRLQRRDGLRVPSRSGRGTGVEVHDRPVEVEIEVFDRAGNRSRRRWTLDPRLPTPEPSAAGGPLQIEEAVVLVRADPGRQLLLMSAGTAVGLIGDALWRVAPTAALRSGSLVLAAGGDTLASTFVAVGGAPFGELRPIAGAGIVIGDPSGEAARPGGLLRVDRIALPAGETPLAMRVVSPVLRLQRIAWAPRRGVHVSAPIDAGADHVVWMHRTGRKWIALETTLGDDADGVRRAWARVSEAGELVLAEDREDPLIAATDARAGVLAARTTEGPHGLPQPRWPPWSISITDRGAGIGDRSPEVRLNGQSYPAVWDPERETLVLDWFVDPGPGRHRVDVGVQDRAGRRAERSFEVRLVAED